MPAPCPRSTTPSAPRPPLRLEGEYNTPSTALPPLSRGELWWAIRRSPLLNTPSTALPPLSRGELWWAMQRSPLLNTPSTALPPLSRGELAVSAPSIIFTLYIFQKMFDIPIKDVSVFLLLYNDVLREVTE